jgi:hypothetical protein
MVPSPLGVATSQLPLRSVAEHAAATKYKKMNGLINAKKDLPRYTVRIGSGSHSTLINFGRKPASLLLI